MSDMRIWYLRGLQLSAGDIHGSRPMWVKAFDREGWNNNSLSAGSQTECLGEDTVWTRHVRFSQLWPVWAFVVQLSISVGSTLPSPAAGPPLSHVPLPKPPVLVSHLKSWHWSRNQFLPCLWLHVLVTASSSRHLLWLPQESNPDKKHRHGPLFQAPSPTLDDIRGCEMYLAGSHSPFNDQFLTSHIHIFLKVSSFATWWKLAPAHGIILLLLFFFFFCSWQRPQKTAV